MAEHQSRNHDQDKRLTPPGVQKPFNHDAHLAAEVKEALLRETRSAGIDIHVAAADGAIRLYGVVDVLSHKSAAAEIVRRIAGVGRIENDITVANEEPMSDRDLREAITDQLARNEEFRQIGCDVQKGVVALVGHAGSYGDVQAAVRFVEGMAGVREVRVERVKVGEGEKEDDADVSRSATQMLQALGFDAQQFQVYSDAGVLFVKGFVPTRAERSRIKTALHKIPGVDKLEALLVTDEEMVGEVH